MTSFPPDLGLSTQNTELHHTLTRSIRAALNQSIIVLRGIDQASGHRLIISDLATCGEGALPNPGTAGKPAVWKIILVFSAFACCPSLEWVLGHSFSRARSWPEKQSALSTGKAWMHCKDDRNSRCVCCCIGSLASWKDARVKRQDREPWHRGCCGAGVDAGLLAKPCILFPDTIPT